MHSKHAVTILILSVLMFTSVNVSAKPKLPAPPGAQVTLMGKKMDINGFPMEIRHFVSNQRVEDILNFYRRYWPETEKGKPGYTETDAVPPWNIITRAEGPYLMTVQVQPKGHKGSTGYIAISKLPDPKNLPKLGKDFPKMRGSTIINDINSKDIKITGRTLSLFNYYSTQRNANFYKDHYLNKGYDIELDQAFKEEGSHSMIFRKRSNHVSLSINETTKGFTVVVAQIVKEGLF
jgi:hypothetical protein